ncbi:sigma-54 dependent transcriptional regulator [Candidatus Methylospira mobilis]|uniref:sigma-54 interaction domain-containing protein n=1 Tax=Candidatus Methylospira mobilis TaxID=1808979 RepID=UPI0028ED6CCB|nr:sigma-54 dependent transcriptional regulator [Candidatus Methylospira mobilis]WNV03589.1 sigma-54 dependent transcriptional regulator [Candidatus Methylospira mobilis]
MSVLTYPNPSAISLSIRASAFVFEDEKSKALLEHINLLAPRELNVLIIGDSGTGKELVARSIHQLSHRRNGPFLAINCGALSESLIESELFGHERGAFTGAQFAKKGWFEAANGGTLFLDEIGDLPLAMQVKLLRVLQEREVVRVGSYKPIPIDVRLVAATNVKLDEAVRAGRFREDLYYRLNVAALRLPPLRERSGDILPLAEYFLKFYSDRLGCGDVVLSDQAKKALILHSWPGNIRELENVIHHALLIVKDKRVSPEDLKLSDFRAKAPDGRDDLSTLDEIGLLFKRLLDEGDSSLYEKVEHELLKAAFEHSQFNQLLTARVLGLSRHVLRARLIRHDLLGKVLKNIKQRASLDNGKSEVIHSYYTPRTIGNSFESYVAVRQTAEIEENADWWGY